MLFVLSKKIVADLKSIRSGIIVKVPKYQVIVSKYEDSATTIKKLGTNHNFFGAEICRNLIFYEASDHYGYDLIYRNSYYKIGKMKEEYDNNDPSFQIENSVDVSTFLSTIGFSSKLTKRDLLQIQNCLNNKEWLLKYKEIFTIKNGLNQEQFDALFLNASHSCIPSPLEPHYQLIKMR